MNAMHATNKPFNIDKRLVYEAYKAVKSNRGAAGVDEQKYNGPELGELRRRIGSGIAGQRSVGGPTIVFGTIAAITARAECQLIVDKVVEEILFGEFAPLASCRVLKLPVVGIKLLQNSKSCWPNHNVCSSLQGIQ